MAERLRKVTFERLDDRWKVVRERDTTGETFHASDLADAYAVIMAAYDADGNPRPWPSVSAGDRPSEPDCTCGSGASPRPCAKHPDAYGYAMRLSGQRSSEARPETWVTNYDGDGRQRTGHPQVTTEESGECSDCGGDGTYGLATDSDPSGDQRYTCENCNGSGREPSDDDEERDPVNGQLVSARQRTPEAEPIAALLKLRDEVDGADRKWLCGRCDGATELDHSPRCPKRWGRELQEVADPARDKAPGPIGPHPRSTQATVRESLLKTIEDNDELAAALVAHDVDFEAAMARGEWERNAHLAPQRTTKPVVPDEVTEARNEAATVRRAYLHEKARAEKAVECMRVAGMSDTADKIEAMAYTGPAERCTDYPWTSLRTVLETSAEWCLHDFRPGIGEHANECGEHTPDGMRTCGHRSHEHPLHQMLGRYLRKHLREHEASEDIVGRILGALCCAATLSPGERMVTDDLPEHAAASALRTLLYRIDELEVALRKIANGEAGDEQAFDWTEFYASIRRFARHGLQEATESVSSGGQRSETAPQLWACRLCGDPYGSYEPCGGGVHHVWEPVPTGSTER